MKKLALLISIFINLSIVFSQNVRVEDYNIPESKATNLRINGFWNWSQVGDSVSGNRANATLLFRKFYSSLPFAWDLRIDAQGGKDLARYTHYVNLDGQLRKYIWDRRDWFASSAVTISHEKTITDESRQVASDLTIGAGYGRYINATALAKAVRIEEHLLKDDIIMEHLPKEVMLNVASIIDRVGEYIDNYGEVYETRWIDDIEAVIEQSGAVPDYDIGSVGILRIRQVLFNINERVNDRYYGWNITAGALFIITNADKSPTGEPNLTINGNYSYPINWRTQINARARVSTPVDSGFAKLYNYDVSIDYIYELSNRINLVTDYTLRVNKPLADISRVSNLVSVSFLFYIENNINLGLNATYEKARRSPKSLSSSITLAYNFY